MKIIVLGAAAGGGLPQWNCGCANCQAARDGTLPAQTQASLAVSRDGRAWTVINASPDIRSQMSCFAFRPRGLRDTPLASVILTGAEIDQVAGLLTLRERQEFRLFATREVEGILNANPVFDVLRPQVQRLSIGMDEAFGPAPGLTARLFAVAGKPPLFLEGAAVTDSEGNTVGMEISSAERRIVYIPGCGSIDDGLRDRVRGADALFFDGTVYHDDELIRLGAGKKTGGRMGHMAMAGPEGSLAALSGVEAGRKIYIHINNTNPVWQAGAERDAVHAAGWEIAHDGMEVGFDG